MIQVLHAVFYTVPAFLVLTGGGNWACRRLFSWTGLKAPEGAAGDGTDDDPRAGRVIGSLERVVIATGIVTHSWEVLAAVIALKTVARFKELNDKPFAEYFLVGSLFSVLWAVVITSAWLGYDHRVGVDIRAGLFAMIGTVP